MHKPEVLPIQYGDLRRTTPIRRDFGYGRGQPIDRYYIESFLSRHVEEIQGSVLEIGDDRYTRQFGGSLVTKSDVLDLPRDDSEATITADLSRASHLAGNTFNCIIFTQTLQYIYDCRAAVATLHRILRPNGRLLLTVPVISQICRFDMDRWGDYWRFTSASVHRLLSDAFGEAQVDVQAYGNVLAAISFLHGLAAEDLATDELDYQDPDYELIITARAIKRDRVRET